MSETRVLRSTVGQVAVCLSCGWQRGFAYPAPHDSGTVLVMRDTGRDTLPGFVGTVLADAYAILAGPNGDQILRNGLADYGRLERLDHGWPESGEKGWRNLTDDERDEYATEYLDDIDTILSDAGFHAITDADQGTWSVYAPMIPETVYTPVCPKCGLSSRGLRECRKCGFSFARS